MEPIRLLLVDDHQLFREGLSRLLSSEPDLQVSAHCGTAGEALELLAGAAVDLILLDFVLGSETSHSFIPRLHAASSAPILIVTARMNAKEILLALQQGIAGIFLKHNSPVNLIRVIRLVAGGEVWVDPKAVRLLSENALIPLTQSARPLLTEREELVLRAILEGESNRRIAHRLGITEGAVKSALQQLFDKAGVRTRGQLVRVALEQGLLSPYNQRRAAVPPPPRA